MILVLRGGVRRGIPRSGKCEYSPQLTPIYLVLQHSMHSSNREFRITVLVCLSFFLPSFLFSLLALWTIAIWKMPLFISAPFVKALAQFNKANTNGKSVNKVYSKMLHVICKIMSIHSCSYQTFFQHKMCARFILGTAVSNTFPGPFR